jgi:CRP/FNR family transcriptional regulator
MHSLTTKQISGRFSELLLYLSKVFYESNPFKLTISRKEMADLMSTSPESVSRLISDFKDQRLIEAKGQNIKLLDPKKLESMCKCKSLPAYEL